MQEGQRLGGGGRLSRSGLQTARLRGALVQQGSGFLFPGKLEALSHTIPQPPQGTQPR